MRTERTVLCCHGVLLWLLLFTAGCGNESKAADAGDGRPATDVSQGSPGGMTVGSYDRIGEPDMCALDPAAPPDTYCSGFYGETFAAAPDSPLADSLMELSVADVWTGSGGWVRRTDVDGKDEARQKVSVLARGRTAALKELGAAGLVVARIEVKQGSPRDARYQIKDDATMERYYFLVVNSYRVDDSNVLDKGKLIANWEVFGVSKAPKGKRTLTRMSGLKGFRYCEMPHSHKVAKGGGSFLRCDDPPALAKLAPLWSGAGSIDHTLLEALAEKLDAMPRPYTESQVTAALQAVRSTQGNGFSGTQTAIPIAAAQTIVRILNEMPGDPVWMHCGVGCCTADLA